MCDIIKKFFIRFILLIIIFLIFLVGLAHFISGFLLKVNHFNSTPVGYKYQISFTIFVDGNLSTFESHDIANSLEREIEKEIDEVYLTVIHVNPVTKNKK